MNSHTICKAHIVGIYVYSSRLTPQKPLLVGKGRAKALIMSNSPLDYHKNICQNAFKNVELFLIKKA